jgi:RNA polymerase sigma factor (TIGR02999 family)
MASPASDVTSLLLAWQQGDQLALDQLLPIVYAELHRLARAQMRGEPSGQTLQTTALVHEAYVRLVDGAHASWNNRAHFFGICARLMRQILVDAARARRAEKRGGDSPRVPLEDWVAAEPAKDVEILALDEALSRLAQEDVRRSKVVELRYFGGLTAEETAAVLGVSVETVTRDWKVARLWLRRQLRETENEGTR